MREKLFYTKSFLGLQAQHISAQWQRPEGTTPWVNE